jgi:signal transduction histidine kinase
MRLSWEVKKIAKLIDKAILLFGGTLLMNVAYENASFLSILGILLPFSISCLFSYLGSVINREFFQRNCYISLSVVYLGLWLLHPVFIFSLPLICYDIIWVKKVRIGVAFFVGLYWLRYPDTLAANDMLMLLIMLAILLSIRTHQLSVLDERIKYLRDESTEYNLGLIDKNKDLMEKQDYEVYLATLKERNRIAREIHDNVGHLLSRSLLQIGALLAICKNDPDRELLRSLKDTLSGAMDSVRRSVHDLHDDSIDLAASVNEILAEFKQYHISFDYDMSKQVPRKVKYCLISIVKEGLSNISKHSNGDQIRLILREHPGMYQLLLEDNGTKRKAKSNGIGLENMRVRVANLNGNFQAGAGEKGFRIFLSIPVQMKEEKDENSNSR